MDGSVPLSKRQASPHWAPGVGLVLVEVSHDVVSFASAEACQVEYAGVLKGAANPEGGKAFVEWMLSKAVQEDIPGQMYMYPVLPDAALPEALTKFGPLSKSPVKVEPKEITTRREEWLNTWTEAVGK